MSEEIVLRLRDGLQAWPKTQKVFESVLEGWPEHAKYAEQSLVGRSSDVMQTTETIATLLTRVAAENSPPLATFADDYRFYCEKVVLAEEWFFRREGRYRLSTFEEAAREVYDNADFMRRYMNGLFVSNVIWLHLVNAMNDLAKVFLPTVPAGGAHLEIGPGHGTLLHLALAFGSFSSLAAWDVSATSVAHTRRVLDLMGEGHLVDVRQMDIFAPQALSENRGRFDTIVFSEVLEHLERPAEALAIIRELLTPEGRVWINVPANAPATDHIFLLRSLDEATKFVADAGFQIERSTGYPIAGATLEKATKNELPVACIIVASKGH
jgi:2-polyprenyl-3-methyl-5-hydroxy-6-metoxy-1,4-benzoquinol methylase